jgi:hypothetical protein
MAIVLDRVEERVARREVTAAAVAGAAPLRRRWMAMALAILLLGVGLAYLATNERQANTQYDQALRSLSHTDGRIDTAVGALTAVRHDLQFLNSQIVQSEKSLSSDARLLQGIRAALTQAQADVSQKEAYISNLKTCQTGVEQALNALSVGDEAHAVEALSNVAAPCQSAAAASG